MKNINKSEYYRVSFHDFWNDTPQSMESMFTNRNMTGNEIFPARKSV